MGRAWRPFIQYILANKIRLPYHNDIFQILFDKFCSFGFPKYTESLSKIWDIVKKKMLKLWKVLNGRERTMYKKIICL